MNQPPLLSIKNLKVGFHTERGWAQAIDGISLEVYPGETLGIVGESGCGKSVTSMSILQLIPTPPGEINGGEIFFRGTDLLTLNDEEMRKIRGAQIAMIFQDPMSALNPVFTIGQQLVDVLSQHKNLSHREAKQRASEMLERVGIPSAKERLNYYPHQFSGGMRQRVMIAMALLCGPQLLIADEPTTALDVTMQAQVLKEMNRLQKEFGMAMALITHDMGVVAETCQRVIVMYCGKIVESANVMDIFNRPRHPYTKGLLQSIPQVREEKIPRLPVIEGMVPDLHHLPQGCRFSPRCPRAQDKCRAEQPTLRPVGESLTACFFPEEYEA